jgi:hypothetical protein
MERPIKDCEEECSQPFPLLPPGTNREDLIEYGRQTAFGTKAKHPEQAESDQTETFELH